MKLEEVRHGLPVIVSDPVSGCPDDRGVITLTQHVDEDGNVAAPGQVMVEVSNGQGVWAFPLDCVRLPLNGTASVQAQVLVVVRDGEVASVQIIPSQAPSEWYADDDVRAIVDTTTWKPLLGLPVDVIWEA